MWQKDRMQLRRIGTRWRMGWTVHEVHQPLTVGAADDAQRVLELGGAI